jgi:hypothetical protein
MHVLRDCLTLPLIQKQNDGVDDVIKVDFVVFLL